MVDKEQIKEDLRRWFKEKWVDISRKDSSGKHPECQKHQVKCQKSKRSLHRLQKEE